MRRGAKNNEVLYKGAISYEQFMHENVWNVLLEAALKVEMPWLTKKLPQKPEANKRFVKLSVDIARPLLLPHHHYGAMEIFEAFKQHVGFEIYFVMRLHN